MESEEEKTGKGKTGTQDRKRSARDPQGRLTPRPRAYDWKNAESAKLTAIKSMIASGHSWRMLRERPSEPPYLQKMDKNVGEHFGIEHSL